MTNGSTKERPVWVHTDGWAGRQRHPAIVVGETPKRYRCKMLNAAHVNRRPWSPGDVRLVPKHAVTERTEVTKV